MEKVVRRLNFEESEREDEKFWMGRTPLEKLEVLTRIRLNFHGGKRIEKTVQRVTK